jgi:CHAT domain-containing protein
VRAGGAVVAQNRDEASSSSLRRLTRSAGDVGLAEGAALARLPFTRREAEAILALAPDGRRALDFEASRATATSAALARYRIVHFATHGLLDSQHPELSGLVLSLVDEKGAPQGGFLDLQDIYNLRLPADLVVLSGCSTALGKTIDGEGIIGLTRGFMHAGASQVLASLWKVDDLATAELMQRFYEGLLRQRLRPVAALRRAQLEMAKHEDWHDPYFWAAFTLQGDW